MDLIVKLRLCPKPTIKKYHTWEAEDDLGFYYHGGTQDEAVRKLIELRAKDFFDININQRPNSTKTYSMLNVVIIKE